MKTLIAAVSVAGLFAGASTHAATILTSDGFESSLGNWFLPTDGSQTNTASLYSFSSGTNYATTGTGAVRLPTTGGRAIMELTTPLALDTLGATSVTLTFDTKRTGTAGTRFWMVDYSTDGGATWSNTETTNSGWIKSTFLPSPTAGVTKTLTEADVGGAFTDNVTFRIRGKSDSGGDQSAYIDNVVITGEGVIPEPSSLALLGLGGLLIARRRRG